MVKRIYKVHYSNSYTIKVTTSSIIIVRFIGKDYDSNLPVSKVLKDIVGLGFFSVYMACKQLNVSPNLSIGFFSDSQINGMKNMLLNNSFRVIGNTFKKILQNHFSLKLKLGFVRYRRLRIGLPVRGQRTKTNAQTCRSSTARSICLRLNDFVAFIINYGLF
jgi:small subunit ribosomal protein S13